MSLRWIGVLAVLAACSEYSIAEPPVLDVEANPPAVDNPVQVDRVVQVTEPEVDVLWVIDSSCSMSDNQQDLTDNFPSFIDYFLGSGLDYHIGVVSMDMDNAGNGNRGLLREIDGVRFIDPDTPDPVSTYARMAQLGDDGSGTEMGRTATYTALELNKNDPHNVGFIREELDAGLHIVAISDEDDRSLTTPITRAEFVDYLNSARPDPEQVTFNSIVHMGSAGEQGAKYLNLTDKVGGSAHDIATDDWAQMLDQLGVVAAGLKREFFLSSLPVVDTLDVKVVTPDAVTLVFVQDQDYTYDPSRNSVLFDTFIPTPLSEVLIEYTVLASVLQ